MICEYCGAPLDPGARYCEKCGRRVHEFHGIGLGSQTQLYTPITDENILFEGKNDLYILDLSSNKIYNQNNDQVGKIQFKEKIFKIICKVYDPEGNLVLQISPVLLSPATLYKFMNSKGRDIARIKKPTFSAMPTRFYIESPFNEKWFQIIRATNYKIQSFATDEIVAEFGKISSFKEIFLDLEIKNPRNTYLLKINDRRVDRAIIIGTFLSYFMITRK
jgi:uncharacterized protein YxjI